MGVFEHIVSEAATDAAYKFSGRSEERRESKKWSAIFSVFALMGMIAFYIQKHSMDGADLLGGRKTIERFMRSNVIAMVILLLSIVGFIILVFRTWKKERSLAQFAFTICSGVILLLCSFSIFRSIHNIQKDLDSPKTVTVESFVTCKGGSNEYYAVFDQEGTIDSILLRIPQDKYELLTQTPVETRTHMSRSYRLADEDGGFTNVQLHSQKIEIVYYAHSVIYEDIIL
ncbi:MAG: hypothetical protein IKP95_02400 [Ruminococcus sp.]|nr:hypothetical protein [Ruminococcus sp.]